MPNKLHAAHKWYRSSSTYTQDDLKSEMRYFRSWNYRKELIWQIARLFGVDECYLLCGSEHPHWFRHVLKEKLANLAELKYKYEQCKQDESKIKYLFNGGKSLQSIQFDIDAKINEIKHYQAQNKNRGCGDWYFFIDNLFERLT